MRLLTTIATLVLATACSVSTTSADGRTFTESGPLRFEVSDVISQPGVLWVQPGVAAENGAIVARHTRYGSLCRYAVTARADVQGNRVGFHVAFSERLTACTAEVRALSYVATLGTAPGTYDVFVIH